MKSNEIITISGKRGYGKTTLAKSIISKLSRVAIWDPNAEYHHPNCYIPQRGTVDEFETWLKPLYISGNICIIVDEADMVMSEGRPLAPWAYRCINIGRHRNLGMIMITRRLANLSKTAVSQSAEIYLFHHFIINDIRYLSGFISNAEEVQQFKKFQYKKYIL